jgi:NAD(P)-dependent dehydrogenase (short-subunit alcohol dehydrogenase family)
MSHVQNEPKGPMPAQEQAKPGLESKMEPEPRFNAPLYRGSRKLEKRVALITGGDSGIGRSVAVLFAREGADVAIVYLREEQSDAETTRDAVMDEGKRCLLIPGDVTRAQFCREAVKLVVEELGQLDILVNNAAYQAEQKRIEDISEDQLDRTFRTNILGYFFMAQAALPHLKEGASIINTGSITGFRGSKELIDYAETKGAIHAFTKSLAQNLVERKIRVNCVAPGPIWTPFIPSTSAEKAAKHGAKVPMERPGQPEEVAPSFVFFASEADSSYITGEVLTLSGGEISGA